MLLPCSWACKASWCWMPGQVGLQAGLASRAQAGGGCTKSECAQWPVAREPLPGELPCILHGLEEGCPTYARSALFPLHHGCTCCRDRYGRLVLGDVITAVNRKPVKTASDLYKQLDRSEIGEELDLEVGLPSPAAKPCSGVQAGHCCQVWRCLHRELCIIPEHAALCKY